MAIETELKLLIAAEDVARLQQHPLLQTAQAGLVAQPLYNTYFDTPSDDLLAQKAGLRVRRQGDKRIQTLKTAGQTVAGLHQRQEWEIEIAGETPELKQLPKQMRINGFSAKRLQAHLLPVFTTDFQRSTWELHLEPSAQVELALDQGEIRTDTQQVSPISEIELELKAGDVAVLYQLALELQASLPLVVENRSKAERGYALYHHAPPSPRKAGQLTLVPEASAEEAFMAICWYCITHLQDNQQAVLHNTGIEGVHQMRVALRRLRSCFTLFKPLIPTSAQEPIKTELKWITQCLGEARDWDVFQENLTVIAHHADAGEVAHVVALQSTVSQLQAKAYQAVRQALISQRYNRLLLQLGQWLNERLWRQGMKTKALSRLAQPISQFAAQVLQKRDQRVRQVGEQLLSLPAEMRHQVRIDVKKLAYGSRFFLALYPGKASKRYSEQLAQLQDVLGELNDMSVANDLLHRAQVASSAPVYHFLKGWYSHQHKHQMQQLDTVWQQFLARPVFWPV